MNKTIAVLPFVNMSASEENEYFSDGITEEIINALAKIQSLKVTSRTSSFFFKNKNIPIKEIGEALNVSAILEGSVRLAGDTIRITAQLIQAEEDFHFWSETWDRKLEHIFEIQDEISLLIAEKLREHFGHFEIQDQLVDKQTDSLDAYDYSLKAKFHFNKWNPQDASQSIKFYEQALQLDPNHTESLLGQADCYGFLATTGFMPYEEAWGKSAELTQKALALNDKLPGAYYQLANITFFTTADYKKSFATVEKAIALNPNFEEAQHFLSYLYIMAGEKEKAFEHLEIALSINPLSPETLFFQAYCYYMAGDIEKSLALLNNCLEHNPRNLPAHTIKCYCLILLGRGAEVLHYFDDMPTEIVIPIDKIGLSTLVYAHKKDALNAARSLKLLEAEAEKPEGFRANSYLPLVYGAMEDNDKVFAWFDAAYENKSFFAIMYLHDPLLNGIRTDPRYNKYKQLLYPQFSSSKRKSSKKQLLNNSEIETYTQKLLTFIEQERPYLNPNLSLRSLAVLIDLHPNKLSWLLNEGLGKNFSEFINHYRVKNFKTIAKDPKFAHMTLVGLAYESGFNSKTVFNTYFKKETELTPKQFLKS